MSMELTISIEKIVLAIVLAGLIALVILSAIKIAKGSRQ